MSVYCTHSSQWSGLKMYITQFNVSFKLHWSTCDLSANANKIILLILRHTTIFGRPERSFVGEAEENST